MVVQQSQRLLCYLSIKGLKPVWRDIIHQIPRGVVVPKSKHEPSGECFEAWDHDIPRDLVNNIPPNRF